MRFLDTNVLLYAVSSAPEEQVRADRANALPAERDLALSSQVLQEFYVQATRTTRPDAIPHADAVELIETFQRFPVAPVTSEVMRAALATCDRFRISYWDGRSSRPPARSDARSCCPKTSATRSTTPVCES